MEDIVKEWYVVNTYAGHENRVKENLERRVETMGLENNLFRILVAEESEIEIKNGKKVERMRNLFPGYLFVEMIMTDEAWYVVRNTRGVTGFVGPGSKPVPLTEAEMKPLGIKTENVSIDFGEGDSIAVVAGVWKDTVGVVQKLDYGKQTATINVEMFGRETPVEISFAEVRKL